MALKKSGLYPSLWQSCDSQFAFLQREWPAELEAWAKHARQAKALQPFVKKAKTVLPLNLAVEPLVGLLVEAFDDIWTPI